MKPKLRLLHGWGVNRNVWNSLLPSLAPLYDVTLVDLPGYGDVVASAPFDKQAYQLESLARSILEANTTPSHWVAWSLGGTIVLRMAQLAPSMFLSLQLVSTTPKFIATEDWQFGIEPEPFQQLAQSFEGDYSKALKKFLLLQVNSDDPETRSQSRKLIRSLHASILQLNSPTVEVLAAGLEVLRSTDLRNEIQNITIPVQIVCGEHDRVVPASASRYLADALPGCCECVSLNTGHLPFLEAPMEYLENLNSFIHQHS